MELRVTVFSYIDDWLKPYQGILPKQPAQKASYSELQGRTRAASKDEFFGLELRVTIAVVGEILAQPKVGFAGSESTWFWIMSQTHRDLFPRLPEYSRYHRILQNAERLVAELALVGTP